jgi:hypothetical protein
MSLKITSTPYVSNLVSSTISKWRTLGLLMWLKNFYQLTSNHEFYTPIEVGGACGTHGRGEKSVQGFGGKARRKETTGKTKA